MKCDTIARGVVNAARKIDLQAKGIPLVVRLAGTNVELGKQLLNESGLLIQSADNLEYPPSFFPFVFFGLICVHVWIIFVFF